MGLNCGIVGLPNVGKSTIFLALTSAKADVANYPFCTIEPNTGMVSVPDERLSFLNSIYPTAKVIPAVVEFVDIAGLVKGASQGMGLGNKFLSHIREVDAIVQVVRCFESSDVVHVDGSVSPIRDVETITAELCISDIESIERQRTRIEKKAKGGDKQSKKELELLNALETLLDEGKWLWHSMEDKFSIEEKAIIKSFHLLTVKPMIFLGNISEDDSKNHHFEELEKYCEKEGFLCLSICGNVEEEIAGLNIEERNAFLEELGISQSGIDRLIYTTYQTLGLITFLTAGEKEVKAWTVKKGSYAPQAAGVIHSDFEKGFIRAEVVPFEDLKSAGNYQNAKANGLVNSEGKEYIVNDGDVVHFRFNV